jgi:hypothetical protein
MWAGRWLPTTMIQGTLDRDSCRPSHSGHGFRPERPAGGAGQRVSPVSLNQQPAVEPERQEQEEAV